MAIFGALLLLTLPRLTHGKVWPSRHVPLSIRPHLPQRHLRESGDDAGPILTPSDPSSSLLGSPSHLLDSPNVLPYEAMRCRLCEV